MKTRPTGAQIMIGVVHPYAVVADGGQAFVFVVLEAWWVVMSLG